MELADAWERYADQWLAWADPAHEDGFWSVTWPTLRQLLPPPDGLVIDLGCGEGRGLRELRESGYDGIGIDRSPTLARAAAGQSPESRVVIADAARLPLFDACASLVFASMSLLDIDDLDNTLAEVRRVLRPGGALCAAIVHPFISAFQPETVHEGTFHLDGSYLSSRRYLDNVNRDGRSMTFASMHRPLHAYFDRLFNLGFVITAVREEGGGPVPWLLAFRATARACLSTSRRSASRIALDECGEPRERLAPVDLVIGGRYTPRQPLVHDDKMGAAVCLPAPARRMWGRSGT